jgi:hypothetical protein
VERDASVKYLVFVQCDPIVAGADNPLQALGVAMNVDRTPFRDLDVTDLPTVYVISEGDVSVFKFEWNLQPILGGDNA